MLLLALFRIEDSWVWKKNHRNPPLLWFMHPWSLETKSWCQLDASGFRHSTQDLTRSSLCLKESKPLGQPIHRPAENCTLSTPNKPPSLQSVPLFLTGFLFTWLLLPSLDSLSKQHPGLSSASLPLSLWGHGGAHRIS